MTSSNEEHVTFLIKTKQTTNKPCLSESLGSENASIQTKQSLLFILLEKVNLFTCMPLALGESTVLLKHFPAQVVENKLSTCEMSSSGMTDAGITGCG